MISLSQGANEDECDNPRAVSAEVTAAIDLAVALGVVVVRSAGNEASACNDDCYLNAFPAIRPEVIAVGGVYPEDGSEAYDEWELMGEPSTDVTDSPNCSVTPISTCSTSCTTDANCRVGQPGEGSYFCDDGLCNRQCWSSALGGADTRIYGTVRDNVRGIVDILAPAYRQNSPTYTSDTNYGYSTTGGGTSHAAPHVAAALVSLLDWAEVNGYPSAQVPGVVNAMTLTMGDGDRGQAWDSHRPAGAPLSFAGLDRLWGAGRLKFRLPTSAGMDSPWGWGWGTVSLSVGDTIYISLGGVPVSSDVDSYTFAMTTNETNVDADDTASAAKMTAYLISTAASGGSCPATPSGSTTYHLWDSGYDLQKFLRMRGSGVQTLHGRCAYARVSYWNMGSQPGPRTVFYSDMWEDLDRECWEDLGQCANPTSSCILDPGCVE